MIVKKLACKTWTTRRSLNILSNDSLTTSHFCSTLPPLAIYHFNFNNQHFLQIHRTAMGTRMAPSYANLFIMGKLEQSAIENDPFKPYVWWRFIDDIFMVWTEGEEHLQTFLHHLNSIHPTIKFTHEYSNSSHQSLPFLDVHVYLDNSPVETDLHTNPTDKHQYLLKTSCHPAHTKRTITFSLALRLRRICSCTDDFFNKRCTELINFLELRGYSRHFVKKEINRTRIIPTSWNSETATTESKRTPFVITYNPALPNVSTTVRKNINILQSSNRYKQIFP